jgi:predicted ATPase
MVMKTGVCNKGKYRGTKSMITKLTFKNLRCFKDFSLDDMTPITLISGRNNVGKTTLLEGLFLLLAYRKADVFLNINSFRNIEAITSAPQGFLLGLEAPYLWEPLFTNMDMAQELSISMKDDCGHIRTLRLEKDERFSLTTFAEQNKMQLMLQPSMGSYALKLVHEYDINPAEIGRFLLTQAGLTLNFDTPPHLPMPPFGIYIGPNIHLAQQAVAEWIGKIELENKKVQLVNNLRLLFEEIEDIFTVPRPGSVNIFSRLKTGQPMPIRAMGDGINKLLHYLSVIVANPGGIFLFDEIETGFHYSFYPKLWELVSAVAKETNSQVIATTHSYECINAAVEGTAKIDSSLMTYVRLGKEGDIIVPYYFSNKDIAYALEREMEVR